MTEPGGSCEEHRTEQHLDDSVAHDARPKDPCLEEIEQAVPPGADLLEAVDGFARYYRRSCDTPDAVSALSLQITLMDMSLHDAGLRAQLAASVQAQERHLVALFTGRVHDGGLVTSHQAQRLVTALRALFVGLSQGVVLGLAPGADERYFADAARALVSGVTVVGHGTDAPERPCRE
ncbi:hypothetical protein ACGF7W_24530 [Streptomyces sp. NPDC048219]|uniref:hypothetical protein n=1 Tax=Streptomyces sp. NPDC048219 TaxID=3365517 RepID=UPI003720136C